MADADAEYDDGGGTISRGGDGVCPRGEGPPPDPVSLLPPSASSTSSTSSVASLNPCTTIAVLVVAAEDVAALVVALALPPALAPALTSSLTAAARPTVPEASWARCFASSAPGFGGPGWRGRDLTHPIRPTSLSEKIREELKSPSDRISSRDGLGILRLPR